MCESHGDLSGFVGPAKANRSDCGLTFGIETVLGRSPLMRSIAKAKIGPQSH